MRVTGLATYGLSVATIAVGSFYLASMMGACDADEHRRSTPSDSGGVGACSAQPGELPAADCDPSDNQCETAAKCAIDTAKCGDISCLPMAKNAGSVLDFRIRRLNIIAPPSLTYGINPTLQLTVINGGVDLHALTCGERGKGTFSWLLELDKTHKTIKTGGAPPVADPFSNGYCFYNHTVDVAGTNLPVQPVTVDVDPAASTDTRFSSKPLPKLFVPIFLDAAGTSVIILPLNNTVFKDVSVSADGNCIGSLNPAALDTDCTDVFSMCSKWKTSGALGGYISLEEADTVQVQELQQSLCVVLTQTAPRQKCERDLAGKIKAQGDYCSTTQRPGDCRDSFWLAATFAASAVKINDGATTPVCQGGSTPSDAGIDASDAETDAGIDAAADANIDAADATDAADAETDAPADASDAGG
jgi:hypothetical protein